MMEMDHLTAFILQPELLVTLPRKANDLCPREAGVFKGRIKPISARTLRVSRLIRRRGLKENTNMGSPKIATIKRLFAVSNNQCAYPGCEVPLVEKVA